MRDEVAAKYRATGGALTRRIRGRPTPVVSTAPGVSKNPLYAGKQPPGTRIVPVQISPGGPTVNLTVPAPIKEVQPPGEDPMDTTSTRPRMYDLSVADLKTIEFALSKMAYGMQGTGMPFTVAVTRASEMMQNIMPNIPAWALKGAQKALGYMPKFQVMDPRDWYQAVQQDVVTNYADAVKQFKPSDKGYFDRLTWWIARHISDGSSIPEVYESLPDFDDIYNEAYYLVTGKNPHAVSSGPVGVVPREDNIFKDFASEVDLGQTGKNIEEFAHGVPRPYL